MTRRRGLQLVLLVIIAILAMWIGFLYMRYGHGRGLILRLPRTDVMADTSAKQTMACPENALTILAFGQSNSANFIRPAPVVPSSLSLANFYNGHCYRLSDPVLGATGHEGSLWPLLAQAYHAQHNRPVTVLAHGVSSSGLRDWLPGSGYGYLERLLANAETYSRPIDVVIFHQGETDAEVGTPPMRYTQMLTRIFDRIQAELPGQQTFLIYGATLCTPTPKGSSEINMAQRAVAEARADTVFVMSTDTLGAAYRYDGCHFNTHGAGAIVAATIPHLP